MSEGAFPFDTTMSADPDRIIELFSQAKAKKSAEERERFLAEACRHEPELREQVESLLRANEAAGGFLQNTQCVSTPEVVTEKPGDKISHYKLLQKIGEGGCGVVYMAEQEEPVRRRVALKIIRLGMDTKQFIARFEAERQALALMDHPNIAKVLDAGSTPEGRPYFVMELVKGMPLTKFCDEQRLTIRERLDLFVPVCQAIQHAHQKGIIHRDIKPSNVLVALYDGQPVPKVIDFGIAKATGLRLTERTLFTEFGALIGTPEYMSPEQAEMNQLDIDTRSDIYSLGVLLYELLTGTTPLTRERLREAAFDEVLRRIREEEPPRPSTRLSQSSDRLPSISAQRKLDPVQLMRLVRGDLDWIVMKALEKDRTRRYETANGLARDIERHLNNDPVVAGPPTAGYRLAKFVHKHRTAVGVIASFLLLLIAGGATSTWLAVLANRQRAEAERARNEAGQRAEAEAKAKTEASRQRDRAEKALSAFQMQRAEELFRSENVPIALAYLAAALRQNPSNQAAADRLLSAMTHRRFLFPVTEPLQHTDQVISAQFSRESDLVATVSSDNTVRVWDVHAGTIRLGPVKHAAAVTSASFSRDGRLLVTASFDKTVRVWDLLSGNEHAPALKHETSVFGARFTPDGRRIVTVSSGTPLLRFWDADSGTALTSQQGLAQPVYYAEFTEDGGRLVTASMNTNSEAAAPNNIVQVWDAITGKLLAGPPKQDKGLMHEERIQDASVSPDGQLPATGTPWRIPEAHTVSVDPRGPLLATVSGVKTVRVWETRFGKVPTELVGHGGRVWTAKFSPDGHRVVTASQDGTARVWDAWTGTQLTEPLKHAEATYAAEFSPDGSRLLTVSADRTARIWDGSNGMPLAEPLRHDAEIWSARFSPDGKFAVTASADHTARIWDVRAGRMAQLEIPGNNAAPTRTEERVGSSPEIGKYEETVIVPRLEGLVISSSFKQVDPAGRPEAVGINTINAPDFARTKEFESAFLPYLGQPLTFSRVRRLQREIIAFAQSKRAPLIAVVLPEQDLSAGGAVQMLMIMFERRADTQARFLGLEVDKGLVITTYQMGKLFGPGNIVSASISDYGGLFNRPRELMMRDSVDLSPDGRRVAIAAGDEANIFDSHTARLLCGPLHHAHRVISVQFSPNGRRVVTASNDKAARIWNALDGKLEITIDHRGPVYCGRFSPDGQRVATASFDGTARVWDAQTGRAVTGPLPHETGWVYSARFSPDSQRLVTAGSDHTARLWDVNSGALLATLLEHEAPVWHALFNPDGARVLTASQDGTARLWSARNGQPLGRPLGHKGAVYSAEFSADGQLVATGSADGTARVWDAFTGLPISVVLQHEAAVWSVKFTPDSKRVVTASADRTARIWEVRSGFPAGEPLKHPGPVYCARLFAAGHRLLTATSDQTVRITEEPVLAPPVPPWLPELAEAVAGTRFDELDRPEAVPLAELVRLRRGLLERHGSEPYLDWAKSFLADRTTHPK